MKSNLVRAALAVTLLAAAGVASAQQSYYRTAQVPGQATPDTWTQPGAMQQGANMESTGDASYGGVPFNARRRRLDDDGRQRDVQALRARSAVRYFLRQLIRLRHPRARRTRPCFAGRM
ncbi:hypothetical protein [Caballeronia sp. LZ019]|uniref:hypothetical protein n=1 Tax=Caballeronia sp. LZ019 TaxID=3038555 RepID=UPI002859838F|nr:hypothetical protein [Caballeronia sp. LZ019]MDR5810230.1 hypothetical protein [Caballeronia sp. LZ019]